ncbi:MAG: peptidoglycan hydrolase RipC [Mycobacterium sp.]
MILEPIRRISRSLVRSLVGAVAVATLLCVAVVSDVNADPASDALARMNELSRQAEQTTEAMHTAQIDLDAKLAVQADAEAKNAIDRSAVDVANAELAKYQAAVDKVAAAAYMGGSTDGLTAALTASSPRDLIDQLSIQKTMSTQMAADMAAFKSASQRAAQAAQRSADSAVQARLAADQATKVRAELQAKQSDLRAQIAAVQAQFEVLTPDQRAILADPGPPPPPVPGEPNPDDPAIVAMPDPPAAGVAPTPSSGEGAAVVQAALTRVGSPYSWGATGPNSFDCSGLIKWAFLQSGKSLPRSSQALAEGGQPVAVTDLQPGDIVTFYADVSHAGIYIGDGMMVHASTYGTPVKVAPISSAPIHNVRRY